MLPNIDEYHLVECDGSLTTDGKVWNFRGTQLLHKVTGEPYGTFFQSACRSMAWKSALIVHEKYKRKYDLTFEDLKSLRSFAENFVEQRKVQGKETNKDFLVQECSAELKRRANMQAKLQ